MKEITYGIRELQAHLSEAIRAVRAGARVVVVSRNETVAEISRPKLKRRKMSGLDRKLERLHESGVLSRPKKTGPMPPFKGVPMPGILEEFLANRR